MEIGGSEAIGMFEVCFGFKLLRELVNLRSSSWLERGPLC